MKIYNTQTRTKEEFIPLTPGKVGIYACGPTVYNYIHIGNARPLVVFDTLRRYLEHKGYEVTFVQNFTDIDDKMINRANDEGTTVAALAKRFIAEYWAVSYTHLSEAEAKAALNRVRAEFPDASSLCYGYVCGVSGQLQRFYDDHEPVGGMPILDAIRKRGLIGCGCAVVRYFGGIKLGTGGLARAFGSAAIEMCIRDSDKIQPLLIIQAGNKADHQLIRSLRQGILMLEGQFVGHFAIIIAEGMGQVYVTDGIDRLHIQAVDNARQLIREAVQHPVQPLAIPKGPDLPGIGWGDGGNGVSEIQGGLHEVHVAIEFQLFALGQTGWQSQKIRHH